MLDRRNYIIMGAAGGIGSELCRRLRAAGARLLLAGRTEGTLVELSRELDMEYRVTDATVVDDVAAWHN